MVEPTNWKIVRMRHEVFSFALSLMGKVKGINLSFLKVGDS